MFLDDDEKVDMLEVSGNWMKLYIQELEPDGFGDGGGNGEEKMYIVRL